MGLPLVLCSILGVVQATHSRYPHTADSAAPPPPLKNPNVYPKPCTQCCPPPAPFSLPPLRPTHLVYLQVWVRADDRPAAEVHPLPAEVAPEAALLALQTLHKTPTGVHVWGGGEGG